MMKIKRFYQNLAPYLKPNKALIIFGPRQAGKTTLIKDFLSTSDLRWKLVNGDNLETREILSSESFDRIREFCRGYELIAIDEAQKINGIGQGLKIMVDQIEGIRVIATGSSSFELAGQIGEPLTGRKTTLSLFPIAQLELFAQFNPYELKSKLNENLVYGSYPEILTTENPAEKRRILEELVQSYLLKDILELERVKSSKILLDLLRLIAFQTGSEVSLSELSKHLGIDYKTAARYLDLFEKSFILFNLRGFSRNLRKEMTKKSKYYFYDNGIRNAVISNFNPLEMRNDAGQLWENFLFIERIKKRYYHEIFGNPYFWRTWDQKEIDLIEEREGKLFGYEFKWGDKKSKSIREWQETYPGSEFHIINRDNYTDFII